MSNTTIILIFTRYPEPGQVKTRLIPALGKERATRLHRQMTEHILETARTIRTTSKADDIEILVCHSGSRRKHFRTWLGRDIQYMQQSSGNIGDRMKAAFKSAFHRGAKYVLTIGSDIPDISANILKKALDGLKNYDIVLGPATDGGYYLIGMKSIQPELFRGMDWGTERVCNQTRQTIRRLGLSSIELDPLQDIDRAEDLVALRKDSHFNAALNSKPSVSVIIPTYNEEAVLERTLEKISLEDGVEIIVSDGGSRDTTREIAAKNGAVVLNIPGGRAIQQNAGAAEAKGELLLFLHADTVLPGGYRDMIRTALDNPSIVAGAFQFRTDSSRFSMRLIEWSANIRSSIFQSPYGDQALFMEKRIFDEEGGFTVIPIMEDLEFVKRLRRRGRIVTLHKPAITSARRWESLGSIRTTLINQIMVAGFFLKVPIHILERLYRNSGNRSSESKKARTIG